MEFKTECPYCKNICECDTVDVGVGYVQCGPYFCEKCGSSEIGPEFYDWVLENREGNPIFINSHPILKKEHPFSEKEIETLWYEPFKNKLSPYANTVGGLLVNHIEAKKAYDVGMLDKKEI